MVTAIKLTRKTKCYKCNEVVKPGSMVLLESEFGKLRHYCKNNCASQRISELQRDLWAVDRVLFGVSGA